MEKRRPRKGRILRVKRGYNPNSSSMGSVVFALPSLLLGTTALFGAVAGLIVSALLGSRGRAASAEGRGAPEEERE